MLQGATYIAVKWLTTFLRCISKVGGAFDIIYKPLIVHTVPFLSKLALKLSTKYQIWVTLSAQEMGYYATRGDTHYC